MSCDEIRTNSFLCKDAKESNRSCQKRRLCVLSKLQVLFRSFEAKPGYRGVERCVGFLKCGSSRRKLLRDLAAHARTLRALAGKDECGFHKAKIVRGHKDTRAQLESIGNCRFQGFCISNSEI